MSAEQRSDTAILDAIDHLAGIYEARREDEMSWRLREMLRRAWILGFNEGQEAGYKKARRQFEYPRDAIDM
jgi:hypothetical protein